MSEAGHALPVETIGIDLGDRFSHACVVDARGVVVERVRFASTRSAVEECFRSRSRARVVMEVGARSPWMSRVLSAMGYDVTVANTRKMPANPLKTDDRDAEFLARLGRVDLGLLYPVEHRDEEKQGHLAILRARDITVRMRTKLINCVRGTVKAFGFDLPSCDAHHFADRAAQSLPPGLSPALAPLLRMIATTSREVARYDLLIARICRDIHPETALLRQVPAVGPITALAFVLVLGRPDRVRSSRSVGAYLGLVPRKSQSGEIDPQLRITKTGDKLLRRLLVGCAQGLMRGSAPDTDLRRLGLRLAAVGGKAARKRAVVAVARRLAVLLHHLWRTAEVYEPLHNETIARGARPAA